MAEQLAQNANAPVYALHDGDVGRGPIGGYVTPLGQIGAEAGRLALRSLRNAGAGSTVSTLRGSYIVDAGAMRRHGLEQARLPPATEQRFAPPSIWRLYQGWIITLLVLVALQFALIAAFLMQSISRRKDRVALTEAAHRFRMARIAGQVGFWQWDPASNEMTVEPELRKLLGYDGDASDPIDWRAQIHEDDLPSVLEAAREHVAGRTAQFEIQHRVLDHNHGLRWFLSRGQILRDRENRPVRLVGTAIDITERKRGEDERSRAQLQLQEQRVELAHLGRAAAAGALSGALAHELKQPLSAILTNAQAGQGYLARPNIDRDEIKEILADIESEGRRAGEVIRHLRNLLRPGEERCELIQIPAVINDVLSLIHSDLVARNVRVVVSPMTNLPSVLADRVQLQQVVLNLINNASDAMSSVEPHERRVAISATTRGDRVHVSFADNGCGLGSLQPDKIFKPFFSTKPNGLGLGLSISRSIVENHGGRIWAQTNPSGGTTLHMEFAAAAVSGAA